MATGPNPPRPPRKPNRRSRPGVKRDTDQMQSQNTHAGNVSGGGGVNRRKKPKS
jgi:hypothetical protein